MRRNLIAAVISTGLLVGPAVPNLAAATQYHSYHSYRRHIRHKRHVNTAKRIGIGVELSPKLRQTVKTHFSLNGELSHGIVSTKVHEGV
jgi:hypothetical protein